MPGIEGVPGIHEQGLLGGDVRVAVEQDDLGLGLGLLEVVGHHAGALVGAGRAAVGRSRHRHDEGAAIGHGFELLPEVRGLRAGLPGVDDLAGGFGFLVALDAVGQHFDAGGEHQAVVADAGAALGGDARFLAASMAVDIVLDHLDAVPGQVVVAVGDVIHAVHAAQHPVGNRAGDELVVRLDQGDVDVGAPRCAGIWHRWHHRSRHRPRRRGGGLRRWPWCRRWHSRSALTAAPAPEIFRKSRRFRVMYWVS